MNYITTFLLILCGSTNIISWIECKPPEIFYTGDHCECPRQLSYQVHVPCDCKRKDYGQQYPYSVIVPPRQTDDHVISHLNFDVEVPITKKHDKLDLYAKVDRIVVKNQDCLHKKSPTSSCSCQRCDCKKRSYRQISPSSKNTHAGRQRSKRDLRGIFDIFSSWKKTNQKRSANYMKIYQTKLPDNEEQSKKSFFSELINFWGTTDPQHARFKRNIMGEYETMKKEEEKIDWTLPEITQFMPEILKPGFNPKSTFCRTCQQNEGTKRNRIKPRHISQKETETTVSVQTTTPSTTTTTIKSLEEERTTLKNEKKSEEEKKHKLSKPTEVRKIFLPERHTVTRSAASASTQDPTTNLYPLTLAENAYQATQKELQNTNPINEAMSQIVQAQQYNAQSAFPTTSEYFYDNLGQSYPTSIYPLVNDNFYRHAKENFNEWEMQRAPLYWGHEDDHLGHLIKDILHRHPGFIEGSLNVYEQDKYNFKVYKDILEGKIKKYV